MPRHTRCRIEGEYIIPPTGMELIINDHCNISCRQCNHISPIMPRWNADPAEVIRDLDILAKVYRPAYLKFIGGEPLLHPDLPDVIEAARASSITSHYLLVTNGMLLDRMPQKVWSLIDEIEISRYRAANLSDSSLERARQLATNHGVRFTLNDYTEFRRTITRHRNNDSTLVNKIFRACKMANVWGCHGVYRKRIYRCPQSMYIPSIAENHMEEGFPIADSMTFRDDLLNFLNSKQPLASCAYCVGTSGRKQPHQVLPRKEWSADLDEPVEQMIDWQLLEQLLLEIRPLDDCKIPFESLKSAGMKSQTTMRRIIRSVSGFWKQV